jgi:3',5'-cyclic AMP phosphodiesterase CpdA
MPTIAHLSDVHLHPLAGYTPRLWSLKRLLGYANFVRARRGSFDAAVLERLVADLQAAAPDHIAVTGDLVNLGMPQEHANARLWLERLGPPQRVSVVPGNHDIYQRLQHDAGIARWGDYMRSDLDAAAVAGKALLRAAAPGETPHFPFLRRVGPVALIGVNSAVPRPPLIAAGRVGPTQRASLAQLLAAAARHSLFRLVLIHHPPLPGQAQRWRALSDAPEFADLLAACGAELVIHGHNHRSTVVYFGGGGRRIPVVGVAAAAVHRPRHGAPLARYNIYRIDGPPWRVALIVRGLAEVGGSIVEIARQDLALAP